AACGAGVSRAVPPQRGGAAAYWRGRPSERRSGYRRRGSGPGGGGANFSFVLDAAATEDLSRAGVCRNVALASAVWAALRESQKQLRIAFPVAGAGGSRTACRGDLSPVVGRQKRQKPCR